ncbi:lysozyme, partial [Hydrocoleum sp. CS-953]|uniref:lysozyme n=2 Tax=Microcoleaceae TaxID=1892252 RepID=UPI000BDAFBFD
MQISQNCLDLIKKWEGLFLNAYLDPVGIPTIGYGTTRYPDGQVVQLGDRISERNAEAYLRYECSRVAREISGLIRVPVNQNQFDALVSFAYNVGTGAFQGSTL